jgi:hypothetical protein
VRGLFNRRHAGAPESDGWVIVGIIGTVVRCVLYLTPALGLFLGAKRGVKKHKVFKKYEYPKHRGEESVVEIFRVGYEQILFGNISTDIINDINPYPSNVVNIMSS